MKSERFKTAHEAALHASSHDEQHLARSTARMLTQMTGKQVNPIPGSPKADEKDRLSKSPSTGNSSPATDVVAERQPIADNATGDLAAGDSNAGANASATESDAPATDDGSQPFAGVAAPTEVDDSAGGGFADNSGFADVSSDESSWLDVDDPSLSGSGNDTPSDAANAGLSEPPIGGEPDSPAAGTSSDVSDDGLDSYLGERQSPWNEAPSESDLSMAESNSDAPYPGVTGEPPQNQSARTICASGVDPAVDDAPMAANVALSCNMQFALEASEEQISRVMGALESLARAAAFDVSDRHQQDAMASQAVRRAALGGH